jgi:hypothetical protein
MLLTKLTFFSCCKPWPVWCKRLAVWGLLNKSSYVLIV